MPSHENGDRAPGTRTDTRRKQKKEERRRNRKCKRNFNKPVKNKKKRACQTTGKTKSAFSFSDIFSSFFFPGKQCGRTSKHVNKPKKTKKVKTIEATKKRGRVAKREAGGYNREIKKGKRKYVYAMSRNNLV